MTEWDGVTILLTKKTHPDELAIPNVVSMIIAPGASLSALVWLLMPWVVKGFNGITSDVEGDSFLIR
jgi:hypothetical protein